MEPRDCWPAELGEIVGMARLAGGLSGSDVFAVTTRTGKLVWRAHAGERATWQRALALHKLAADAGIAPKLAWVDEARGVSIAAMIEGASFAAAVMNPAQRGPAFVSMMSQLARLHAIPLDEQIRADDDFAKALWAAQSGRAGFPAWALALGARLDEACATIAPDLRRVFSHKDLNPMNALWDGQQVWLLDWDAAGLAHPYLDLATLANLLVIPDGDALGLLAAQERAPITDEQRAIFAAMRELARIVYGATFLGLVPDLTAIEFAGRAETPALLECYGRLASGALSLASPTGQALLGAAMFKSCSGLP